MRELGTSDVVGRVGLSDTEGSPSRTSSWILTGAPLDWLKLIAMVLMVFDHVNTTLLDDKQLWMSWLGRGAFPLFAYAMACHLIKRPKLDNYLQRLLIFALFSQPAYVLALHDNSGNILFTLACGAIVGAWVIGEAGWRRHVLFTLALSSFFFSDFLDFGLVGVMLPTAIACALRGDRFAWPWLVVLTLQLNGGLDHFFVLNDGLLSFTSITQDDIMTALCALILPVAILVLCRQFQGRRFLFRYALYLFYPAHLYVLALLSHF
jgi:hypothetical protein